MGEEERDRLVVDVADALTLNQDVDWDRCAREATPASHRTLDNLRVVADVLASFRVQEEEAAGETAMGFRLPGGVARPPRRASSDRLRRALGGCPGGRWACGGGTTSGASTASSPPT